MRMLGRGLVGLAPSSWLLVDITLLALGVYLAFIAFPPFLVADTPHVALWQATAVFTFAVILASLVFGLYERETVMSRSRIFTRMLLTAAATAVLAYGIIYVIMYSTVSRRMSGFALAFFCASGVGVRLGAWWAVHRMHRGLLVVGSRSLFLSLERARSQGLLHEYQLTGYVTPEPDSCADPNDPFYLGGIDERLGDLARLRVTDLVVGGDAARDPKVMQWMVPCLQGGCRVTNEAIFFEKATGQILVDEITPAWFLFADLKVHCDERATLKRVVDLVTAGLGLCLLAPLWPILALAIKLGDGGKVLYSQVRVGQNGRTFRLYKLRTMRPDAENGKSVWCAANDPRVTRVGRFLRRTRLDELPQLYNVLRGDMSIVGPRPERPDIVAELSPALPYYSERHLVKPGLTGWAQISFRYGSSVEDAKRKLQFDLYYLKHMSFELDMIILFRTLGTFLRGAC
jgi:sugar transferase (PEP-CTERM system associated)